MRFNLYYVITSYVCDLRDPRSFVQQILRAYQDPEYRAVIAKDGVPFIGLELELVDITKCHCMLPYEAMKSLLSSCIISSHYYNRIDKGDLTIRHPVVFKPWTIRLQLKSQSWMDGIHHTLLCGDYTWTSGDMRFNRVSNGSSLSRDMNDSYATMMKAKQSAIRELFSLCQSIEVVAIRGYISSRDFERHSTEFLKNLNFLLSRHANGATTRSFAAKLVAVDAGFYTRTFTVVFLSK